MGILLLIFGLLSSVPVLAQDSFCVVDAVISEVRNTPFTTGPAVVVFDLDETLVDSRPRTLKILHEFVEQDLVAATYPQEVDIVGRLRVGEVRYLVVDTLRNAGIGNEEFIQKARDFWRSRYYTGAYCREDVAYEYAVATVKRIWEAGAFVVYLTGRDVPDMFQGTRESLNTMGFPMGSRTRLMMKPAKSVPDLEFKKASFDEIALLGHVVAGFENEPKNLNAIGQRFKDALLIFLDTQKSPQTEEPSSKAHWLAAYPDPSLLEAQCHTEAAAEAANVSRLVWSNSVE